MAVIINGTGTVGIRAADVISSLGIEIALVKYDAKQTDGKYDIRTREALEVCQRHRLQMDVAEGPDADQRVTRLREAGFDCPGIANDEFFRGALVVDAIDNKEQQKAALERYKRLGVRYNTNGGAKPKSADGRVWVSAPNTYAAQNSADYVDGNH